MADRDVIVRAASGSRAAGATATGAADDSAGAEEVRAFLQQRVGNFGILSAGLFSMFLVWRLVSFLIETSVGGEVSDWRSLPTQAAEVTIFAVIWLACRGRPRSLRFLRALDMGGVLLASVTVLLMPFRIPYFVRPDYIVILALTYIMLVRAIYIPSTARRTLTLGLIITPGLMASLFYVHYLGHDPADYTSSAHELVRDEPRVWATRWTIIGAVWWTAATVLSTVTSRVFYGLRKEARDARRLGQYTLIEAVGEGGMGVVYRASHALLRRPTAVKLLPPDKYGDESVARFEREVQLTALLTHPNTVRIFDYGRTPDNVFYYAMELLDGANLDHVIKVGGPMPAARVIHILDQAAGALSEAHGIGLIHRDIKPANVILTEQGGMPDVAKVVDFGLVKEVAATAASGDEATMAAITRADSMAGTPQYMAPESITTPDKVDARADIYALGAVGYFLLAGVEVFRGRTILEVCSHHLHTEPLPPSKRVDRPAEAVIPADLEAVILRCLAKDPEARPASARKLRAALAACADADGWSEDEARDWWTEYGPRLRNQVTARASGTVGVAATIAVDLTHRDLTTVPGRKPAT
ncbi:MAG TPA: serine/threonine-protein kinase [Kofleriaceae bacterium]|nr:serine/threonine-protein kinase [Kofleriaceae bacterium]